MLSRFFAMETASSKTRSAAMDSSDGVTGTMTWEAAVRALTRRSPRLGGQSKTTTVRLIGVDSMSRRNAPSIPISEASASSALARRSLAPMMSGPCVVGSITSSRVCVMVHKHLVRSWMVLKRMAFQELRGATLGVEIDDKHAVSQARPFDRQTAGYRCFSDAPFVVCYGDNRRSFHRRWFPTKKTDYCQ